MTHQVPKLLGTGRPGSRKQSRDLGTAGHCNSLIAGQLKYWLIAAEKNHLIVLLWTGTQLTMEMSTYDACCVWFWCLASPQMSASTAAPRLWAVGSLVFTCSSPCTWYVFPLNQFISKDSFLEGNIHCQGTRRPPPRQPPRIAPLPGTPAGQSCHHLVLRPWIGRSKAYILGGYGQRVGHP